MAKLHWERVTLDTLGWLWGARSYLEEVVTILPHIEDQHRKALFQVAKESLLPESDQRAYLDDVDSKFRYWIPRLFGYSVIILVHTVVETQLLATANRLCKLHEYQVGPGDFRGDPITRSKVFLTKIANLDVGTDTAWPTLRDLAKIRHIIVHRGEQQGSAADEQDEVRQLLRRYEGRLSLFGRVDDPASELQVSSELCRRFIDDAEHFFRRLFAQAGLPQEVQREQ